MSVVSMGSGRFENGCHHIAYRIYYEDTDAGGIVYYGNYLRFAERARTEALRLLNFHQKELHASTGMLFVVRHVTADYTASARLDDVLFIETSLQEMGKARMNMRQVMRVGETVCATIDSVIVAIGANGRPVSIPIDLRETLQVHFSNPNPELPTP